MGNLIYNSSSKKSVKLSTMGAEAIYRGIVIEGSRIAKNKWEKNFIVWFSRRNQNVLGTGVVGFDVTKIQWNKEKFQDQKNFIIGLLNLVKKNNSWNNFNYIFLDDYCQDKISGLIELFSELREIEISEIPKDIEDDKKSDLFKYCSKHQVLLNDYPEEYNQNCMVCGTILYDHSIDISNWESVLPENYWQGSITIISLEKEVNDKEEVFKIVDRICNEKGLIPLGNLWNIVNINEALEFVRNGLTYDLAFTSSKISEEKFVDKFYAQVKSIIDNSEIICSLTNTSGNPWGNSYGWWNLTDKWTFNVACIIATKNKIIFNFFVSED